MVYYDLEKVAFSIFIDLVNQKYKGGIRLGGTCSGGDIGGRVRGGLRGRGSASVHPATIRLSSRKKPPQFPLAICSSMGLLECGPHVSGDRFYTAVSESWKYGLEAQSGRGQQKLYRIESREGRALFCKY